MNYLGTQCISPLTLWVRTPLMTRCTRYNIMWYNLWVSVVFSINKTDRHDITEMLLKVALNIINQSNQKDLHWIRLKLQGTRVNVWIYTLFKVTLTYAFTTKETFFLSPSSVFHFWLVTSLRPHHMAFTFLSLLVLHVFVILVMCITSMTAISW